MVEYTVMRERKGVTHPVHDATYRTFDSAEHDMHTMMEFYGDTDDYRYFVAKREVSEWTEANSWEENNG